MLPGRSMTPAGITSLHTEDDLKKAISALGFGKDGPLCGELDAEVDDNFIAEAWKDCVRRAWRDALNGRGMRMMRSALLLIHEAA